MLRTNVSSRTSLTFRSHNDRIGDRIGEVRVALPVPRISPETRRASPREVSEVRQVREVIDLTADSDDD